MRERVAGRVPPSGPAAVAAGPTPRQGWGEVHALLREAALAATRSGTPLSLLMLGVEGGEAVDRERALQELGERIAGAVRGDELVARYAGDGFLLVLPDTTLAAALARGEILRRRLRLGSAPKCRRGGPEAQPSLAIGAAEFRGDEALGLLLRRVVRALAEGDVARSKKMS